MTVFNFCFKFMEELCCKKHKNWSAHREVGQAHVRRGPRITPHSPDTTWLVPTASGHSEDVDSGRSTLYVTLPASPTLFCFFSTAQRKHLTHFALGLLIVLPPRNVSIVRPACRGFLSPCDSYVINNTWHIQDTTVNIS